MMVFRDIMGTDMVVALAGRRVDEDGAPERRFPLTNAGRVQAEIREILVRNGARVLVCSAACGADLLALEAAGQLGMRRRVVLPFDRRLFREISVVDRPGDWGGLFDRVLDEVDAAGDLLVEAFSTDDEGAFRATNRVVLGEGIRIAQENREGLLALVAWNGISRGDSDTTDAFLREARALGMTASEVSTL